MRKLIQTYISNLSHEGRGISKINGKTTFIHNALPGETITFYQTHKHRQFNEGQAQDIITASEQRVTPACPHYDLCGGCSFQHWQYEKQIQHKHNRLVEQLQHIGQTAPQEWLPPVTGPRWQYRHKARLGVRYVPGKGEVLVGFRERNGRYITDMHSCCILHPAVGEKIDSLRHLITQLSIREHIAQIEVAIGDDKVALIFRHLQSFTAKDIEQLETYGKTHHFDIYLQPNKPHSVHKLYPQDNYERLNMKLNDHQLELLFHPTDFTQINPAINQKMIAQALQLLAIQSQDQVLDLFCGIGNFSLPLAKQAKTVTAVEGSEDMVKRGNENAYHNHINNIRFYSADLNQSIAHHAWAQQSYHCILLDPPRSGALALIKEIPRFNATRIVYVSCHPATLARDAAAMIKQGYRLAKAGIMDMFPQTTHVESIALFTKNQP